MSQLISDSPFVTGMKTLKTEPWPIDKFKKQFDLEHLPSKNSKARTQSF